MSQDDLQKEIDAHVEEWAYIPELLAAVGEQHPGLSVAAAVWIALQEVSILRLPTSHLQTPPYTCWDAGPNDLAIGLGKMLQRPTGTRWTHRGVVVDAGHRVEPVPGGQICRRCGMRLHTQVMDPASGRIGIGAPTRDECPNGCGAMDQLTVADLARPPAAPGT